MKKKKTGEKPAKKSGKTLGKTSGMWGNFVFWTKRIWDKSPLFVCLYAAEIPVWVGIYLLDAYLPSVLVEDVTAGKKRRGGGRAAAYCGRDAGGIPCGAGLASKRQRS